MSALPIVLVGAGRIATGNQDLAGPAPLSHLAAIRDVGRDCAVVRAIVDPDPAALHRARTAWSEAASATAVSDMAALSDLHDAVVVVCTPTAVREAPVDTAIRLGARAIVVEKPLAGTVQEARALHAAGQAAGIPIVVNYNRRFDDRITSAVELAVAGGIQSAELRYGRGLLNYASHMLDLLVARCGPVAKVQWIAGDCPEAGGDANPSFALTLRDGTPVAALGHEGLEYDLLDLILTTRTGRVRLLTGGAEIAIDTPEDDLHYKGYRHLATGSGDRGAATGFSGLYRALHNWLAGQEPFAGCDSATAVHLADAFEAISQSAAQDGAAIRLNEER
jgi:predicted dehydrogenase